jgi:hypothetical protein
LEDIKAIPSLCCRKIGEISNNLFAIAKFAIDLIEEVEAIVSLVYALHDLSFNMIDDVDCLCAFLQT